MKREELFEAIGGVKEELVADAWQDMPVHRNRRRKQLSIIGTMAACFVVVAAIVVQNQQSQPVEEKKDSFDAVAEYKMESKSCDNSLIEEYQSVEELNTATGYQMRLPADAKNLYLSCVQEENGKTAQALYTWEKQEMTYRCSENKKGVELADIYDSPQDKESFSCAGYEDVLLETFGQGESAYQMIEWTKDSRNYIISCQKKLTVKEWKKLLQEMEK